MQELAKNPIKLPVFGQVDIIKISQVVLLALLMCFVSSSPIPVVTFSPTLGSPIPDKLTLFSKKRDYNNEQRVSFYGPQLPPTVSEVMLEVCETRGYSDECARSLVGMAWKESNFKAKAVGDSGKAQGFFQIHYRLHRVELSCTQDLRCSANWTIDYLESNGYPNSPMWAIQCHNGCGIKNGYAYSAQRHGRRIWSKEMGSSSVALRQ